MPFKLFWLFMVSFLSSLFAPQPNPHFSERALQPEPEDNFEDLEPTFEERSPLNAFDKFKAFLGKINVFRHFTLISFVASLPHSEAELTDEMRASLIYFISTRIPDPQDAQEVLTNIFEFVRTGRNLAIGVGIKAKASGYVRP